MLIKKETKISLTAGLALFAMFFGAGNLIFPLAIGAHAGNHLFLGWLGFVIAGVGLPFLGLFAISLYEGDYWRFFNTALGKYYTGTSSGLLMSNSQRFINFVNAFGKYAALAIVTFIILVVGPLFAAPRTEDITFSSLQPFLPHFISNPIISLVYFGLIFLISCKQTLVIDIIGRFLSPLKLIAFVTLIIASLVTAHSLFPTYHAPTAATDVFTNSLSIGYGTMDLLAAFFFCNVAYKNIVIKCSALGMNDQKSIMKIMLKGCLIGAFFIALIYTGFMLSAATHATELSNISTPALINRLSNVVLGGFGSLFVCICVTLACIATATALAVVSSNFFHKVLFREKMSYSCCLALVLVTMYVMSILGFDKIMAIATPILNVLYPCLILLCIINITKKLKQRPSLNTTTPAAPLIDPTN